MEVGCKVIPNFNITRASEYKQFKLQSDPQMLLPNITKDKQLHLPKAKNNADLYSYLTFS